MEVMRSEVALEGDRAVLPRELFEEVVREVGRDTDRLHRVAARFSQIGSMPKLETTSLLPVVEATVDYFRRRLPGGVELIFTAPPDPPPVRQNAELLGWVLENLIKNAQNAVAAEGGKITVHVEAAGDSLQVRVRDNGHGVKPGFEKRIFRPGVSTRPRGWGLGLPLAQRIVEMYHGGRLELTWTEAGRGAEFTVTLPVASR
jgi:signal transduction histidine kinase